MIKLVDIARSFKKQWFIIDYDLHESDGEDYEKLITAIEELSFKKLEILKSSWLINSPTLKSEDIKEILKPFLKKGSKLVIIPISDESINKMLVFNAV